MHGQPGFAQAAGGKDETEVADQAPIVKDRFTRGDLHFRQGQGGAAAFRDGLAPGRGFLLGSGLRRRLGFWWFFEFDRRCVELLEGQAAGAPITEIFDLRWGRDFLNLSSDEFPDIAQPEQSGEIVLRQDNYFGLGWDETF